MATDYAKMSVDLSRFYGFTGKVVLYIGAAGRQLIDLATPKKLVAIDKNADDLQDLKKKVISAGLQDSVEVIAASFEEISAPFDVVYFEFCLHEMEHPLEAITHAKSLAPDVVVYDHSAGSEWVYYTDEEDKVSRSSQAMKSFGIRRRQMFQDIQRFANHAELLAKVGSQGPIAIERTNRFADSTEIAIPFSYELVFL